MCCCSVWGFQLSLSWFCSHFACPWLVAMSCCLPLLPLLLDLGHCVTFLYIVPQPFAEIAGNVRTTFACFCGVPCAGFGLCEEYHFRCYAGSVHHTMSAVCFFSIEHIL